MTKSLAERRQNPSRSRPERAETICLAPHLVAEVQALTEELASLPEPTPRNESGEPKGPPRRIGVGEDPRACEIRKRLAVLLEEMAAEEGELRLRAISDGDWRRWANAHPAREGPQPATDGREAVPAEPGYFRDHEVTNGYCNADDLMDALGTYAHSWNGELLAPGDWDAIFVDSVGGPDLKKLAATIVAMHEKPLDFRQWRTGLSAGLTRLNGSASPETSPSAPADSSDGNPPPSSEATTKKAAKSR